ncbi:DNA-directed RNA polymerase sigma-70 factor [Oceaniferula spumae]|uniref:DNA-directed RNA polymerase sigma-70 factor n=1 Tax=Oceaniferula spumae TaxID=2979115 RepID=A0AAT9FLK6_9BACT
MSADIIRIHQDQAAEDGEIVRLLTEHQASLRAYLHSLMPGSPDVKDVLQETNMTLWQKRERFREGSNFIAWAFAVARLKVKEQHARTYRDRRLVFNDELLDTLSLTEDEAQVSEVEFRQAALARCMEKLAEDERGIVDARYQRGNSLEEHALKTGCSAGSLRIALFRIRAALKQCVAREVNKHQKLR